MSLYFIIFGGLIGSQLKHIGGFRYMDYLTPGLIMMAVITNSYSHTSFAIFSQRFQRSIEQLLVSPTSNLTILLGNVVAGIMRGFIVGFVVLIVALFFTHLQIKHIGLSILVFLLAATLFSTAGFINGIYAKTLMMSRSSPPSS